MLELPPPSQTSQAASLTGRKDHPFAQPIWDTRIQALWITFTGIYVIFGSYATARLAYPRWVSSFFLTIAAILVILLVSHSVVAIDKNASRKTLLIALTACLFFVQKSGDVYKDYNGVVFSILFSIFIFILVWLPDDSIVRDRLKLHAIAMLIAAIIFSAMELLATVCVKMIMQYYQIPYEIMVISPHVAGISVGMSSFFLLDTYLAQRANCFVGERTSMLRRLLRILMAVGIAIFITHLANMARFKVSILNTVPGIAFSSLYVVILVGVVSTCIWLFHVAVLRNAFARGGVFLTLAVVTTIGLAALHRVVQMLSGQALTDFVLLCTSIYSLPAFSIVVATIATTVSFRTICGELYECTNFQDSKSLPKLPQ
jgi:hypothetical protein